jgi:H+/Cl- antiporter ClcA
MLMKKIFPQAVFLIFLSGICAVFSALFLVSLNYFFHLFTENLFLVLILPFYGLFCVWLYRALEHRCSTQHLTLEGIFDFHAPSAGALGWGSAVLVLGAASFSQLFGASTGREGASVQYGASLGAATAAFQKKFFGEADRNLLIQMGLTAGFSSLFGAPLAALLFLLERPDRPKDTSSLTWCLLASFLSYYFSLFLNAPHSIYAPLPAVDWSWTVLKSILILVLAVYIAAVIYKIAMGLIYRSWAFLKLNPYQRIILAGGLLAALTGAVGSARYNGLGTHLIASSLTSPSVWYDFPLKSLFTLLSVTSGFKGGEVTPLMSIGACLGSFLSGPLQIPVDLAAALSCIFFFSQVLGIPLTGIFLAVELFGWKVAIVAALWGFGLFVIRRLAPRAV